MLDVSPEELAKRLVTHLETKLHDPQFFRTAYSHMDEDQRRNIYLALRDLQALHPTDENRRRLLSATELIESVRLRFRWNTLQSRE